MGYPSSGPKAAYAMLPRKVASVRFEVITPYGVVYQGTSTRDVGAWNSAYPAVYQLSFSGLRLPGVYQVKLVSPAAAVSPAFIVGDGTQLYRQLVDNSVRYFTSERDGADVVSSVMGRQPANLTDEKAYVYADPRYDSNDNLLGTLKKTGGPVDVSGGWFDAGGGYEKFAYTASYADALMLLAARALSDEQGPNSYAMLAQEAAFGLQWITKLWNPARKVLYAQVGIGTGNASNTIQGDYNFWFLPQQEDRMNVKPGGNPGPSAYYVKYRPVFPAAPPGQKVSPNLAGRFAADFALGAQLAAGSDPASAAHLLSLARSVYAMAKTTRVGQLVTAFPHDFYPASQWTSDMLWGATEIALADEAAEPRPRGYARTCRPRRAGPGPTMAQGHDDTFNLYDTGAVAEAELIQAMRQAGDFPVAPRTLLADMAAQLRAGQAQAAGDPFALGTTLGDSDASPHAFGLFITDALYQKYGGSGRFASFAQQQLNFALGANGWGTSFVVGAGTVFPHCMQSEIANLAGSTHRPGKHPAGRDHRRAEQPGQLRGPGHRRRDARLQRGSLRAVQHQDRRLRGQRGVLAFGRACRRLHRQLPDGVRPGRGSALAEEGAPGPRCWPSTAATARPTWPWWPRTARCSPPPAAPASTRTRSASTRPC